MGPSSPVKIIEIMGRNAGWLTAAAALGRQEPGDPPHLIYVPEYPVDGRAAVQDVERVVREREHCVIALSEGAVPDTGTAEVDAFGHRMKGGAADRLAQLISDELGLKVRHDRPNYLQRSFSLSMSETDAEEAYRVGRAAVRMAVAGHSDLMITLERQPGRRYACRTGAAALDDVANAERLLPEEYLNEQRNDVTELFLDYAHPLIGSALPRLARLEKHPVPPQARRGTT
jgi:6-phosphofructokinase 1